MPNISVVWQTQGFERMIEPIDAAEPPWLPWNEEPLEEVRPAKKSADWRYHPRHTPPRQAYR